MRKRKNQIFLAIREDILNNTKAYFIVLIIFAVGTFLGVMFINQKQDKSDIQKYINTYIDETNQLENGDYIGELQKDIKNNIILVLLLWFAGTTIIGIPIVLGIILVRGFCLGYTISACVFALGKIKGIMFILTTIFLQNIIFIPAILAIGVSGFKLYKSIVKDRNKENIKVEVLRHTIFSVIMLCFLCISAMVEILISTNILRNFIKYF